MAKQLNNATDVLMQALKGHVEMYGAKIVIAALSAVLDERAEYLKSYFPEQSKRIRAFEGLAESIGAVAHQKRAEAA